MSRQSGLYFELTQDPANMAANDAEAAGSSINLGFTCPGAQLGDFVVVAPPYDLINKVVYSAFVDAADSVNVVLLNCTAGAVNLGSGTWRIKVIPKELF